MYVLYIVIGNLNGFGISVLISLYDETYLNNFELLPSNPSQIGKRRYNLPRGYVIFFKNSFIHGGGKYPTRLVCEENKTTYSHWKKRLFMYFNRKGQNTQTIFNDKVAELVRL